jgi:hypothetical protein
LNDPQEAWERIQAVNGYDGEGLAGVRDTLGRHIIKLATDGERDLLKLRDEALAQLTEQGLSSSKAESPQAGIHPFSGTICDP